MKWAEEQGEQVDDFASFINTEKFHKALMADMLRLGKEQKVGRLEVSRVWF